MAPLFEDLVLPIIPRNLEQAIPGTHAQGIFLGTDTYTGNILLMCTSQCKDWCLFIPKSIKGPYTPNICMSIKNQSSQSTKGHTGEP